MIAYFFFLVSFIKDQFTPEWLRKSRNVSRDVIFALQEARLCQDVARSVKEKASLSQKLASGVNLTPRNSFAKSKPHETCV